MNESNDGLSGGDDAGTSGPDVDARFDPAASGSLPPHADTYESRGSGRTAASSREQFDEMVASCNAWVRDKPGQALAVAAGLGFLLGRIGR